MESVIFSMKIWSERTELSWNSEKLEGMLQCGYQDIKYDCTAELTETGDLSEYDKNWWLLVTCYGVQKTRYGHRGSASQRCLIDRLIYQGVR